jgi:sulfur carrier protein
METLTVNGKPRAYAPQSVAELIAATGIDPSRRGVAVAVNESVLPRAAWVNTKVSPGDKIEIVQPLAGG